MKFRKQKKGDLSIETIIVAALALLVLLILAIVFRAQIGQAVKGYFGLGETAINASQGQACEEFMSGRFCTDSGKCTGSSGNYNLLPYPGDFSDCKSPKVCCERVAKPPTP